MHDFAAVIHKTGLSAPSVGSVSRILVTEVNWLGDAVMSLPALRAIRGKWPSAHLAVLVKRELSGLFDHICWVDSVIPYSKRAGVRGIVDHARIALKVRTGSFDVAILFPNNFRSALWAALANVPVRAGYIRDHRGPLLTHKVLPPQGADIHQSRYWLAMIRSTLGIEYDPEPPRLQPGNSQRDRMRQWLRAHRRLPNGPIVALAPCAAFGPAKQWPADLYAELIKLLRKRGAECVLIGAPTERIRCQQIAEAGGGAMLAAGETQVVDLIALLSICSGFVGNDSGSAHVSAAVGVPTIAIFGSTNPARTAPIGSRVVVIGKPRDCSPCFARTCRFDHYDCLRSITPQEVVETLERLCAFDISERESLGQTKFSG